MRWLHARGEIDKAMAILRRIAKFNKREIPEDVTLTKPEAYQKPNPIDVFRPQSRAVSSLIQGKRASRHCAALKCHFRIEKKCVDKIL